MDDLERLARKLHRGALGSLSYMAVLLLAFLGLFVWGLATGELSVRRPTDLAALVLMLVMGGLHLHQAMSTLRTRLTLDGLVQRTRAGEVSLPWSEVSGVTLKWRRVILERAGEPRTVVSLLSAPDVHDFYAAICAVVPLAAFRAADA